MPLQTFTDAGGAVMRWMEVDGLKYAYVPGVDQQTSIRAIRDAKGRDDDVILIAFNKSGTHWMWEVLSMLYNGKAETIKHIKQENMLEAIPTATLDAMPSPRVLNTHCRFEKLPKDMLDRKVKIVLIHRNLKDVSVSMYNHHIGLIGLYDYSGKWEDYLPSVFLPGNVDCGSWFDYMQYWEQVMKDNPDYPIHMMYYEDMKENSTREIKKLVKFLEHPVTDELCAEVAEKCQFENMKKDKKGLESEYWKNVWKDGKPEFYRKGEVGDWKNWFTVAQNEMFDKMYQENMSKSELKFRYEL